MGQTGASPEFPKEKKRFRGIRGGKKRQRKKEKRLMVAAPVKYGIYNLSTHELTPYHISLLAKGLSFSPSSLPNQFELFVDLNRFISKLTLMRHFSSKNRESVDTTDTNFNTQEQACIRALTSILAENDTIDNFSTSTQINYMCDSFLPHNFTTHSEPDLTGRPIFDKASQPSLLNRCGESSQQLVRDSDLALDFKHSPFHPVSTYFPYHSKGNFIDTFYTIVLKDLEQLCQNNTHLTHRNLSKGEELALKNLKDNTNIVVRQADKGGAIVLQDRQDYVSEAARLLMDSSSYRILDQDPVVDFQLAYQTLIHDALSMGIITKVESTFLFIRHPRTPVFYHLPKLHKDTTHPPGRPIISGVGSMTSNVSQYVDYILQPYVKLLPSYIKDTLHVIDSTSEITWKDTFCWATCDVCSLYTCIDHTKGLEAINHFLSSDPNLHVSQKDFILSCIKFILTHNYFTFDVLFICRPVERPWVPDLLPAMRTSSWGCGRTSMFGVMRGWWLVWYSMVIL
ncbi:uncharacterized protein LOC142487827 [Ascaphus truei]|uniref:uncharacterized protein LOC142487827 n=1 Tax=Ascaphus truei TaxID=8439 RepID=UPI003F5A19F4